MERRKRRESWISNKKRRYEESQREHKNHERVIKAVEMSVLRSLSYCKSGAAGFSRRDRVYIWRINQLDRKETETKAILIETLQYINFSIFFRSGIQTLKKKKIASMDLREINRGDISDTRKSGLVHVAAT